MKKYELYDYCLNDPYAHEHIENEIIGPLWEVVRTMVFDGRDLQAFTPDISKISVFLWATLNARCHVNVTPHDIQEMLLDILFPQIEKEFRRRLQSDPYDLAIGIKESDILMLYGSCKLVNAAKTDFLKRGKAVFENYQ